MTLTVSEFIGTAVTGSGPSRATSYPFGAPIQLTQVSSGGSTTATSTIALTAATQIVVLSQGSGGQAFFAIGGSSTATAPSSTQVEIMGPNTQVIRGVRPSAKLFAFST